MMRKQTLSLQDIKRGFSAADPKRAKNSKKVDLKVRAVEESTAKFGNECLCQGTIFNSTCG